MYSCVVNCFTTTTTAWSLVPQALVTSQVAAVDVLGSMLLYQMQTKHFVKSAGKNNARISVTNTVCCH